MPALNLIIKGDSSHWNKTLLELPGQAAAAAVKTRSALNKNAVAGLVPIWDSGAKLAALRSVRESMAWYNAAVANAMADMKPPTPKAGFFGAGGIRGALGFLGISFGAMQIKQLASEAIQTDIAFQRVQNTLQAVTGDAASATQEFQWLLAESKRIGFSFTGLSDVYAKFAVAARSAGLSTEQTRHIFSSIQGAATVMGLSTDRASEAFLALEQMLAKGRLSMEEVRRQFGNAMPGALNIMARSLGVTLTELYKLIENGNLLSTDVLPRLADQFQKEFNLTPEINKTIRDLSRLQTAWQELKAEVGKGLRTNVELSSESLVELLELLKQLPKAEQSLSQATGTTLLSRAFPILAGVAKLYAFGGRITAGTGGSIPTTPEEAAALDAARFARLEAKATGMPPFKPNTDEKERLRTVQQIALIEERIKDLKLRNYLNSLTREERLAVLKKQEHALTHFITVLAKKQADVIKPEQVASARLELEEIRGQIASLADKETKNRPGQSLGSFAQARAGTYVGGPNIEVSLLEVNKEQLQQLRDIKAALGAGRRGPLALQETGAY